MKPAKALISFAISIAVTAGLVTMTWLFVAHAMDEQPAMRPAIDWSSRTFQAAAALAAALLIIALLISRVTLSAAERAAAVADLQTRLAIMKGERDAAQAVARTKADLLAAALDGLQDGLAITDANMCLQAWNNHFAEVASFPPEILRVGLPMEDILYIQALGGQFGKIDSPEAEVARRMVRLRSGPYGVVQRQRPDGRTIELQRKGMPDGGFVTVYIDITEQKRTEAALREARSAAANASASKAAIIAGLMQEAEPALEALSKHLAAIPEGTAARQWSSDLAGIRLSAMSLRHLIDELAELERINSGKVLLQPRLFDIRQLVESILSTARLSGPITGTRLDVSFAEDVPALLHADPERLRQVLMIGLATAMKNIGGDVRVQLDAARDPSPIVYIRIGPASAAGKAAPTLITTTAPLADPASPAGADLGPIICRDLMTLMGGSFRYEPTAASGSSRLSMHIALPFDEIGTLPAATRSVSEGDADRFGITPPTLDTARSNAWRRPIARTRVLLVDDVVPSQIVGATLLRREGHYVDVAESGEAAVEAVARRPYDVVFMDILMPGISGVEATRAIRGLSGPARTVPIIALTADVSREDEAVFRPAGMNGSLGKPIALHRLLEAIGVHVWSRRAGESNGQAIDRSATTLLPASITRTASAAAGKTATTEPVLAADRIMELRTTLPLNTFVSLIEDCLNDLEDRLPALRHAFAVGSITAITEHSHAILGVAGGYGMAALENRLRGVIAAARTGNTLSLGPDMLRQVEADLGEATRTLREMMQDVLA